MKNPWMSLWLSAANKAAGPVRGFWTAEAERQRKAMTEATFRAWGLGTPKRRESKPKRK